MTTTGQAEEAPFLGGMEREPVETQKPVVREYTFSIARSLVNIHGLVHSVADVVSALAGKVRTLADGPIRDPESEYERGMRAGRRHYVNGDAHPREPNGEKRLLSWILGVLGALVVIALAGGFTLYGEFTALKATVATGMKAHEQRLARLEAERDQQRYRGTNAQSP